MHLLTVAGLLSVALFADNALANPVCDSKSVVFVTVSAPAVTKTITVPLEKNVPVAAIETVPSVSQTPTPTDITATLTNYITLTEFIKVNPAVPTPSGSELEASTRTASHNEPSYVAADEGPYYFSKHDGTLVWLDGKTPPASASFVTSTAVVTLQPVPSGPHALAEESAVITTEGSAVSTSYSTVSLQRVSTVFRTRRVTATVHIPAVPVKVFSSLGSSGWNTTFTTQQKGDQNKIVGGTPKPIVGQSGAIEKGDNKPKPTITRPVSACSSNATEHLQARQVGALVVATIDGELVSWTNTYDGEPTSTPPLISWINVYTGPLPAVTPSSYIVAEESSDESVQGSDEEPASLPIYTGDLTPPVTPTIKPAPSRINSSTLSSNTPVDDSANEAYYTWDLTPPLPQQTNSEFDTVESLSSFVKDPDAVGPPFPLAIYPWDLTPPLSKTTTSDPGHAELSTTSCEEEARATEPAENVAILPQPRTTASAPSSISSLTSSAPSSISSLTSSAPISVSSLTSSAPSSISALTSSAPSYISSLTSSASVTRPGSQNQTKSTFSTVTTKFITSVLSFTSGQPTSSKEPSRAESSGLSSASNNPSSCDGEISGPAEFVLTFDDLPTFSTGPDDTDIPPIFNPYRKLYFEEHFGYVPPPSVAFLPHSPPQLAVYRVGSGLNVNGSPGAGLELVGEFGSGPRSLESAFWINAFSFWIGCDNAGPSDCKVSVNGYKLSSSIRTAFLDVTVPPCGAARGCQLTYVELGEDFRNLVGVQILASVDRELTDFYLDDVSLAWSNNTCAAQQQRATVR